MFQIESRVPSITPECTIDSDCPSQHACVNQRCQNPCTLSVLCSPDQECHVQDTVPYKTIMCQCRPDTVATIDGRCKPIGIIFIPLSNFILNLSNSQFYSNTIEIN